MIRVLTSLLPIKAAANSPSSAYLLKNIPLPAKALETFSELATATVKNLTAARLVEICWLRHEADVYQKTNLELLPEA